MDAQLRIISGPFAGERIPVHQAKFIVGREQDCQFRPDSEFVSRHHCVLLLDEYALRVRDLGSKNGTFVNGRRISGEVILQHDDMISLGELTMQVDLVGAPALSSDKPNAALMGTDIFDGNTLEEAPSATGSASPPEGDTKHLPEVNPISGTPPRQ